MEEWNKGHTIPFPTLPLFQYSNILFGFQNACLLKLIL